MADPLSITASILNVTTAALQSVQYLAKTIDDIKDVPEVIRNVKSDLNVVAPVLQRLSKAASSGEDEALMRYAEIVPAVQNCERACTVFQQKLQRLTKHSSTDKTAWADRWRIGMFNQERIHNLRRQLNDCKSTLDTVLLTAILYDSWISHTHV